MNRPAALSFAADIKSLFTAVDVSHMKLFFDLSSYDDVKTNSEEILNRLNGVGGHVMPPPPSRGGEGPWPPERIAIFQRWRDDGCQP